MVVVSGVIGGQFRHAGALAPACAEAAGAYHVALVVEHDNGAAPTRTCVPLQGAEMTAEAVLTASGVSYTAVDEGGSLGKAVCQVQGEPPTPGGGFNKQNCFGGESWAIFCSSPWHNTSSGTNGCYTADGSWQYSSHGISSLVLRDGDALGLKYESGPGRPATAQGLCPSVAGDRPPPATATAQPAAAAPVSGPATAVGPKAGPVPAPTSDAPGGAVDPAPAVSAVPAESPAAGVQALATPPQPRLGARVAATARPGTDRSGVLAAAAAGAILLVALIAQVVGPRWHG